MGIFFEPRVAVAKHDLVQLFEEALETPRAQGPALRAKRDELVQKTKKKTPLEPRWRAIIGAIVLVLVFAALAWAAEKAQMPKATDNLWTACQAVMTIVLGFVFGEASGTASG